MSKSDAAKRIFAALETVPGVLSITIAGSFVDHCHIVSNRLRAFQPWPGAHTRFRGKTLQILKARPTAGSLPHSEMKVVSDSLLVGCGQNTSLEILELQLEGKKRTTAKDFIHGYNPKPSEKLGL